MLAGNGEKRGCGYLKQLSLLFFSLGHSLTHRAWVHFLPPSASRLVPEMVN